MHLIIQPWHVVVLAIAGVMNRQQQLVIEYLAAENQVLKEQLQGRGRVRFTDRQRCMLAGKAKALGRNLLSDLETLVTPDTLLRWYRQLVARKYDGSGARKMTGRPRVMKSIEDLVVDLSKDNPMWGYTRLRDTVRLLGHEVARSSVAAILARHGLELAPLRGKTLTWKRFLSIHWGSIAATAFFTHEVCTAVGLVRYHVLFVIDLATRRVTIAGIAHNPGAAWTEQAARNLTDAFDGFLLGKKYLIYDLDPLFTGKFRHILLAADVKALRLPARSPNLNAYAERFVLSIKSKCLNHLIILGEVQLRRTVESYVKHYHAERPHQGLGGSLVSGKRPAANHDGEVVCHQRLGGLLKSYSRTAA